MDILTQTIKAVFENGVLKPMEPFDLPEHTQVRVTVELPPVEIQIRWEATKEERLAALEELMRMVKSRGEHLTREQLHERR
jgi:predicted DNA-binding antitoxin AbrB/MazE fold protein